jgi:hypothetical protein
MHATMNGCLCDNMYYKVRLHFNPTYSSSSNNINNDECIYNPHKHWMGITLPMNV